VSVRITLAALRKPRDNTIIFISESLITLEMVKKLSAVKLASALICRDRENISFREIARRYGISKTSAHRIWKRREMIRDGKAQTANKRKPGPRPSLDERDKRLLIRTLHKMRKTNPNITVMSLVKESGLNANLVHRRTFTRYLNGMGFHFLQSRKKGLLSDKDKQFRLKHAREMKRVLKSHPDFYTKHVAFYLDGVSFVHKYNPMNDASKPKSRVWRRRGEGLSVTAKGSKELPGGRRVHLMVAVGYQKGVILREPYEKMDGKYFASFIKTRFNIMFARAGAKVDGKRLFVMDNDPSQTSRLAMTALTGVEAKLHRIPPRSPDLNPVENVFHLIKKRLEQEALELSITKETFDQFKQRVLRCCDSSDIQTIDRTIVSMPKRIDCIIKGRGLRTKY